MKILKEMDTELLQTSSPYMDFQSISVDPERKSLRVCLPEHHAVKRRSPNIRWSSKKASQKVGNS